MKKGRLHKAGYAIVDSYFLVVPSIVSIYALVTCVFYIHLPSNKCLFYTTLFIQVRDPMPAVFFFLIDVSMNALQTGATAAACSAINQVIADLPVSSFLNFNIMLT